MSGQLVILDFFKHWAETWEASIRLWSCCIYCSHMVRYAKIERKL